MSLPAGAQDFFVPDNAFGTVQNKFPTPAQNTKVSDPRPYRVIDGRVYQADEGQDSVAPIQNVGANNINKAPTQNVINAPLNSQKPAQNNLQNQNIPQQKPSQPLLQPKLENSEKQAMQTTLPDNRNMIYQELFNTYASEKETFQKQHKFPKNEKLENMLKDFQKPHNITVFQDTLE